MLPFHCFHSASSMRIRRSDFVKWVLRSIYYASASPPTTRVISILFKDLPSCKCEVGSSCWLEWQWNKSWKRWIFSYCFPYATKRHSLRNLNPQSSPCIKLCEFRWPTSLGSLCSMFSATGIPCILTIVNVRSRYRKVENILERLKIWVCHYRRTSCSKSSWQSHFGIWCLHDSSLSLHSFAHQWYILQALLPGCKAETLEFWSENQYMLLSHAYLTMVNVIFAVNVCYIS